MKPTATQRQPHRALHFLPRISFPLAWLAVTFFAASAAHVASAQELRLRTGGFIPVSYYDLLIDGEKPAQFQIYESDRLKTLLVESSELSTLVELVPRTREYRVFPADAFTRSGHVLSDSPSKPPTSTAMLELNTATNKPIFEVEGRRCELRTRKAYVGPATREQLIAHAEAYAYRAELYEPKEPYVSKLKAVKTPVTVRVFLGTWCHSCGEIVPGILALQKALEGSAIHFEYYGIPQDRNDPEVRKVGVNGALPFVVISNEHGEIGRAQGPAWRIPELTLENTLLSAGVISG